MSVRQAAEQANAPIFACAGGSGGSGKNWHVNRAIEELSALSSFKRDEDKAVYGETVKKVQAVLRIWANRWAGQKQWSSFLHKSSFLHEVEETIVPLHHILLHLAIEPNRQDDLYVVDLCSGKGFLGMLLSYLAVIHPPLRQIKGIVLVEKSRRINWSHVDAANADAANCSSSDELATIPIIVWQGVDLHDPNLLERMYEIGLAGANEQAGPGEKKEKRFCLVGIHLCRRLSSRFVELVNALGKQCTFAALAPCCLPHYSGGGVVKILTERKSLSDIREQKMQRRQQQLNNKYNCWKCGESGHNKYECTATDEQILVSRKQQQKQKQPAAETTELAVAVLRTSQDAFKVWVGFLLGSVVSQSEGSLFTKQLAGVELAGASTHGGNSDPKSEEKGKVHIHDFRKSTWLLVQRRSTGAFPVLRCESSTGQ